MVGQIAADGAEFSVIVEECSSVTVRQIQMTSACDSLSRNPGSVGISIVVVMPSNERRPLAFILERH